MMKLVLNNLEGSGDVYLNIMKAICCDTSDKSMVDLMCYHSPYNSRLGFKEREYVDIFDRKLDDKNEQKYFIQSEVIEYLNNIKKHFDVSICSDGIEHLTRSGGIEFLEKMSNISDKQVLFTPYGEWMVEVSEHPDTHKSGWDENILESIFPNYYAYIILPHFHRLHNCGAFFFWHSPNIQQESETVFNNLKNIYGQN